MTLAACSNSDELTGNAGNGTDASSAPTAVQFSTYLAGGQTRAAGGKTGAITNTELQSAGFGVFAYNTGEADWAGATNNTAIPNFMYNQKVTYNNNVWEYTPIKYWPNDFSTGNVDNKQGSGEDNNATGSKKSDKVSFFAYAPFVEALSYENKSSSKTYGKLSDNNAAIEALETADPATTTAATDGIIGMTFNTYQGEPLVQYKLASTNIADETNKVVDLLWGQKLKSTYALADGKTQTLNDSYNVNLTKQSANEKIGFSFKHALARLGGNTSTTDNTVKEGDNNSHVKVILDIDNGKWDASTAITGGSKDATTLVTVKSIKIQDYNTYIAEHKDDETKKYTDITAGQLRNQGWFNIATGKWDATVEGDIQTKGGTGNISYNSEINQTGEGEDTKKTYTTLATDIAEPAAVNLSYSETEAWKQGEDKLEGVTTTAKPVYATPTSTDKNADNGVLLIPSDKAQTFVVTVDYFVRTYDSHLAKNGDEGTWTKVEQVITNAVDIPADALSANKVYTLLIHLGLTSVKFEAVVADWENADDSGTTGGEGTKPDENPENQKDIYLPSNTISATTYAAQTVNITADETEATIKLTGLGDKASAVSLKENSAKKGSANATLSISGTPSGGSATVTVSGITANTASSKVTYTATLQVKDSEGNVLQEIEVTIVQAAKATTTQTA